MIIGHANFDLGGKAIQLQRLAGCGFPVPAFDVISGAAWSHGDQAERRRLQSVLESAAFARSSLSVLTACAEATNIVVPVVQRVMWGYVEDRSPFVALGRSLAVRSSAAAEDGLNASSAGQYESVLGVTSASAVVEAGATVVASYLAERAVAYRRATGASVENGVAISVVVQQQIFARASGVCFSVPPVELGLSQQQSVVESTLGVGTCLVSGQASPDRYFVDRNTRCVRLDEVGTKRIVETIDANGRLHREESSLARGQLSISEHEAALVAEMACQIESDFGMPVDVEWAIDPDGKLWALQARAITTGQLDSRSRSLDEVY